MSNLVLVRKSTYKWRMYADFKDLNMACPKDSYPLSCIDQLVDTTFEHEYLKFMDTYSRYNEIKMAKKDATHTTFYKDNDIYRYTVLPFRLIITWATYQNMVNKLLANMIGDTMEAYVDSMSVNL